MELQSRYQSDKRFALDERFLEDDPEKNDGNYTTEYAQISETPVDNENDENDNDVDIINEEEKLRQAEILKGIIGDSGSTNKYENTKK